MAKVYTTTTKSPKPLGGGGKHFKVDLNKDVIIWRIANEIYKDPMSGVRELMANGITAIENAISSGLITREEGLLTVEVTDDKKLIISDNGVGITMETFKDVLRIMGNSGNFDGKKAGKFGMGFYAFSTLSSSVIIDTVAHDGTRFSAVCTDGRAFDVYPSTSRKERGTTITLSLYDGEKSETYFGTEKTNPRIRVPDVLDKAYMIALASKVPITIRTSHENGSPHWMDGSERTFDHSGIAKLAGATESQCAPEIITGEGLEVAILYHRFGLRSFYLAGMPISAKTGLPKGIIVNMLDEREFEPTPNREELTTESASRMEAAVRRLVSSHLEKLWGITDYRSLVDSGHGGHLDWARTIGYDYYPGNFSPESNWDKFLSGTRLGRLLDENHGQPFVNEKGHECSIFTVVTAETPAICKEITPVVGEALKRTGSKITRFMPNTDYNDLAAKLVKKWGVPTWEDRMAESRVTVTDQDRHALALAGVDVHYNNGNYHKRPAYGLDGGIKIIMARPGKFNDVRYVAKETPDASVAFMAYKKALASHPRITQLEDWIRPYTEMEVQSNNGKVRLSTLLKNSYVHVLDHSDAKPALLRLVKKSRYAVIIGDEFPAALRMAAYEAGCEIKQGYEWLFKSEAESVRKESKRDRMMSKLPYELDENQRAVIKNAILRKDAPYTPSNVKKLIASVAGIPGGLPGTQAEAGHKLFRHLEKQGDKLPDRIDTFMRNAFDSVFTDNGFWILVLGDVLEGMFDSHAVKAVSLREFEVEAVLRDRRLEIVPQIPVTGYWKITFHDWRISHGVAGTRVTCRIEIS